MDYATYDRVGSPAAYEVEFNDTDGFAKAVVTVARDDLEVVWTPGDQ